MILYCSAQIKGASRWKFLTNSQQQSSVALQQRTSQSLLAVTDESYIYCYEPSQHDRHADMM